MAPAGDIMRTLLIADVHANLEALRALPAADTIICAGDLVGLALIRIAALLTGREQGRRFVRAATKTTLSRTPSARSSLS
jgi:hypothetical protein